MALDDGPVQEADAFVCGGVCVAAGAVGVAALGGLAIGAATGWALREYEVLGSNPPPEGLTADTLRAKAYDTANVRQSTNASTFVDNRNIIQGIEHAAYGDAKMAAIDALNQELSQSAVQDAAVAAVNEYELTVKRNFLKTWNESVNELMSIHAMASEHSGFRSDAADLIHGGNHSTYHFNQPVENSYNITPEGDSFTIQTLEQGTGSDTLYQWDPFFEDTGQYTNNHVVVDGGSAGNVTYLQHADWKPVYDDIDAKFTSVRDGIILWVDTVYSQVEAGELDPAELLTPRELAAMTSDDEEFNQAIADLMALNVAVDLDREARVYFSQIGATLDGVIATTAETTLQTGSVDPSADSHSYFFTYDASEAEGTWSAFESSIDAGTVTFTQEPYSDVDFHISTTDGETATVTATAFTNTGTGFEADLSNQLDTATTSVDEVTFDAGVDETTYVTVQLVDTFEILTFVDSGGVEHDSAEYTKSQPHDDSNYITKEEWKAQEERHSELIEKFEESQSGGSATEGASDFLSEKIMGIPIIGWGAGALALGAAAKNR
ncbi:hypothetical protein [Haloprofundus salilacus]|uniref:hypothetical protein n=1 Tax=Haloprofundus salilacus TaxID=2876190 RepID=UPI001CCC1D06|nr:hypothetical protein [Haloprofundus salilacus]